MTPGQLQQQPEDVRPEPALQSNLQRVSEHLAYAPFRLKGWAVEDATTGARLAGPYLTELMANTKLKKLRKQHPSAFVQGGAS